jgi:hypothetical protein
MASKSKRASSLAKENIPRKLLYWSGALFLIKVMIAINISAYTFPVKGESFLLDNIWLGADGENYLTGYVSLLGEGVFSKEGILNYWPAGYPLVIYFLTLFGESWVLTSLSIFQTLVFSFALYFFTSQLTRTRLRKYALFVFFFISLNPTLSLSSIVIGYESLTASGFLLILGLIVKDFVEKNQRRFLLYLIINSSIVGLMSFMQPRLIVAGLILNLLWIITRVGLKSAPILVTISLLITLFFPATLIYRNNEAINVKSISTNLGVTMNIGAGDTATGGYMTEGFGVPCDLSGTPSEQDNQRVRCVLDWYVSNPTKAIELFYNKSIFFWSPWFGPVANGTMARNPWLTISPIKGMTSTQDGINLVYGNFGKMISWLWLIGGLGLMFYGYKILWQQESLERFIANLAMLAISFNWLISLISIGDHRFRIPIMGLSLFLQAVGLRTLFRGGRAAMVDGPALR